MANCVKGLGDDAVGISRRILASENCRDMIELFKIVIGKYDSACIPHFEFMELSDNLIRTRGNRYKLVQQHCHYDLL